MKKLTKKEKGKLYGALKRAWKGYKIARIEKDTRKLKYYAEGIAKIKKQLGLKAKSKPIPKRLPQFVNGLRYRESGKTKIIRIGGIIDTGS